jgi:hypothetical protein
LVCSACLRRGLLASTSRTVRAMPKVLRTRVTVIPLGWIRSLVCPPGESNRHLRLDSPVVAGADHDHVRPAFARALEGQLAHGHPGQHVVVGPQAVAVP